MKLFFPKASLVLIVWLSFIPPFFKDVFSADAVKGEQKSVVCSACHGPQGIAVNPDWPHLAGQHASYLNKQLMDFKRGNRQSAIMAPLVGNLSEEDMADIAAFYAQQPLPKPSPSNTIDLRGQTLYRQGDKTLKITACITCHGPDGRGNSEANFPSLQYQSKSYLIQQLVAFQSQQRRNDLNGLMHDISSHLSDEDIRHLADYITNTISH